MNDKPVRVRIAPSPTGYLHVGVARTGVFNWLFARNTGGKFLIRIEDTDLERNQLELVQPILDALKWLGMESDEEVVHQSSHLDVYKEYAKKILESGKGYRCFCTPDELKAAREKAVAEKAPQIYDRKCLKLTSEEIKAKLDAGEKYAIRLQIPEGETKYHDLVCGDLTKQNQDLEDFIIARSNGTATYNLAVVVDDHDMNISHVIRGNDHITNTFKQIIIYKALGFDIPEFCHIPLILRPDKKKVSKRLGDKDVNEYSTEGILPDALFNYLCTLGWSSKDDQEIFTIDELVKKFTVKNFNSANAIFDPEKMLAFNKEHIKVTSDHDLASMVAPLLVDAGLTSKYWLETRWEYLRQVIGVLKDRVKRISDFVEMSSYFFTFEYKYEEKAVKKNFKPEAADRLQEFVERLESLDDFTHDNIEQALTALSEEKDIKKAKYIHPTRLAVSGTSIGPGLYDLLVVLSKPVVIERMKKAIDYVKSINI